MTGAELEITADLVRDVLREQHPDLAGAERRPGSSGRQASLGTRGSGGTRPCS